MRTRPVPNRWCQTRLTITRAVSGFSADGDPLGQLQPAAAGGCERRPGVGQDFEVAARDRLARPQAVAADEDRLLDARPAVGHARRQRAAATVSASIRAILVATSVASRGDA